MKTLRLPVGGMLLLAAMAASAAVPAPTPRMLQDATRDLSFERNQGQAADDVRYLARGAGYALMLTHDEARLHLQAGSADDAQPATEIRSRLLGAQPPSAVEAEQPLATRSHYLRGGDPKHWQRDVPHYGRVRYHQVYPGVDLVYYGRDHELEYDFVLAPGADPAAVHLRYAGMQRAELDAQGALQLHTASGVVTLKAPVAYQDIGGLRRPVTSAYRIRQGSDHVDVAFELGSYDASHVLVIDPVVSYATYLGSRRDDGAGGVAVDAQGNIYVAGSTRFNDFPVTAGALQPGPAGGDYDAFVSKLSADGTQLLYSTYLGGSSFEVARGLTVDAAGSAYVTGQTLSADFPTRNPVQAYAGHGDAFLVKLSPEGNALVYGTFLGGAADFEAGDDVAVDANGLATVVGTTWSEDFPVRAARQPQFGGGFIDAFVTRYTADGRRVVFSTYLGGSESESTPAVALDGAGRAYVAGGTSSPDFPVLNAFQPEHRGTNAYPSDAFLTKLNNNGSLAWSTFLGGTRGDAAFDVAVDASGIATVAGGTNSPDFPLRRSQQTLAGDPNTSFPPRDAFVTRFARCGCAVYYSSLVGGTGDDSANGVAIDAEGRASIAGTTRSSDLPLVDPVQGFGNGSFDAFVAQLAPNGSTLNFSSYLGGQGFDFGEGLAQAPNGDLVVVGGTSGGYPTVNGLQPRTAGRNDAFIARLSFNGTAVRDVIRLDRVLYNVREDSGVATITLSRTGSGYGDAFVTFATADGSATAQQDYLPVVGGVGWSNGQTGVRRVQIVINGDTATEGIETVLLRLSNPGGFATLDPDGDEATLRILDPVSP